MKVHVPAALATLATCAVLCPLPAQKVAMTDGSERHVAILDVGSLLPENRGLPIPAQPTDLQRLAAFVRAFAVPPGQAGADLQPLGVSHLAVLGSPPQVAAAERLVVHSAKVLDQDYQLDVRMCELPAAVFDQHVAPLLQSPTEAAAAAPPAPQSAVLDAAAATTLLKALRKSDHVKLTQFPQIVARGLQLAKLRVGKQLSYVRDFEIEVTAGAFVANPVVDVLFDGFDVDVMCGETRAGVVGVQMQLVDQVVEKPIQELTTTIPGSTMTVKVQVPRILTGCRASQTVELVSEATAIMAARKSDGSWLVSLMTPMVIRSAPAALPRAR